MTLTSDTDLGRSLVMSRCPCEANACGYCAKLDAQEQGMGIPETVRALRVGMGNQVGDLIGVLMAELDLVEVKQLLEEDPDLIPAIEALRRGERPTSDMNSPFSHTCSRRGTYSGWRMASCIGSGKGVWTGRSYSS
ncbi:unnamed protein product [Lota lota]